MMITTFWVRTGHCGLRLERVLPLVLLVLTGLVSDVARADDTEKYRALIERVSARMPVLANAKAVASAVPGIVELRTEAGVVYVTDDGRYLFGGPLYDLRKRKNLTASYQNEQRADALAAIPESEMIVFEPKGEARYTLTTFTDIDCGFCRKLHREMKQLNDLGIRVRYLLFPRAGLGSDSHRKAVAVYCSKDQQDAMTVAKAGDDPGTATCDNPVEAHLKLGRELGLRGTPFSVTASGEAINGYLSPRRMLQRLSASGG
ncbi:MAG: DsbC family protein [Pseudomonadota bacterium]